MIKDTELTATGRQYAAAYAMQYTEKNLRGAFERYRNLVAAHPTTKEAEYSRSQIQNIVNAVIPKEELLDVYMDLASNHFEHRDQLEAKKPASVKPHTAELCK
ncbi:MAG: hypothetical protein ABIK28_22750 [Planctomycetota bacterium]